MGNHDHESDAGATVASCAVLVPAPQTNDGNPPIEEWERDGVITELARLALTIRMDGAAALPRTDRLTAFQLDEIAEACRRASETEAHDA
jgi:hypothetical protein